METILLVKKKKKIIPSIGLKIQSGSCLNKEIPPNHRINIFEDTGQIKF